MKRAASPVVSPAVAALQSNDEALYDYVDQVIDAFGRSEYGADADLSLAAAFVETAIEIGVEPQSINSEGISRVANRLLGRFGDDAESLTETVGALWCWLSVIKDEEAPPKALPQRRPLRRTGFEASRRPARLRRGV
jgi:hypothetical protein